MASSGEKGFYAALDEVMNNRCGDCPGAPEASPGTRTYTQMQSDTKGRKET